MSSGIIYKSTSPNGKVYIGKTAKCLQERIKSHLVDYLKEGCNFKFYNALKKYGFENFKWEVLYENVPKDKLNDLEKWTILNYNSYNDGLNSTLGGDGGDIFSCLSKEKQDIARLKLSLANKGKKQSQETKDKISKNHKKPLLGIKQSTEWISKRIIKATKTKNSNVELMEKLAKRMTENNPAKRPEVRKKFLKTKR